MTGGGAGCVFGERKGVLVSCRKIPVPDLRIVRVVDRVASSGGGDGGERAVGGDGGGREAVVAGLVAVIDGADITLDVEFELLDAGGDIGVGG